MKIKAIPYKPLLLICLFCQIAIAQFGDSVASPASAKLNRARGLNMLSEIKEVIKERYYDKTFRGIDLDERFKIAAVSCGHIYEVKSTYILQPGPAALTEGIRQIHKILAHVAASDVDITLAPIENTDAALSP